MTPRNIEQFKKRSELSPLEAVKAWLEGELAIGDEPALISAIRKDTRVTASDSDIEDVIIDAMDAETDAETCLEQLAKLGSSSN